jgi:anti-sigma B factor antagonist
VTGFGLGRFRPGHRGDDLPVDFSLDLVVDGPVAVVTVAGEIDVATAEPLRQALADVQERGARRVVLDLSAVEFLDSTGLGVLVGALRRLRESGGELYLTIVHAHVLKVLRVTNLDQVFVLFDDVTAARAEAGLTV